MNCLIKFTQKYGKNQIKLHTKIHANCQTLLQNPLVHEMVQREPVGRKNWYDEPNRKSAKTADQNP